MKKNINVLVIPTWYPNGEDKLIGIYHKDFCNALSKREGIKVNMLYIDRMRIKEPLKYLKTKKHEVIKEDGYDVYMRHMLDVRSISYNWSIKKYVKCVEKEFKEYLKTNEMPDILHAEVTIPAGYAACVLGKKYNIPVVVTEHSSYFKRFFEGNEAKYGNYVLDNAYFTTVSNYMAREMPKKADVLPNLVKTDEFHVKREKVKGLKLITVSALREGKGIDDIIEALKMIIDEEKIDASLTIIGDGFLESYYKKRCQELGMEKHVNFLGRIEDKKEIAKYLKEHNIFVIASKKETFCIPGVEALASGMPVVSTKCLGPEEYLNTKTGELVPINDNKALKEAILKVYKNLDKYDQQYLINTADKYSAKNITDKAIAIYEKLIEEKEA